MAAVDATVCAIEGTVNWARRDEGLPAFAGAAAAVGVVGEAGALTSIGVAATEDFDLGETGVGIGLADEEEAGMDGGLTEARGLETVEGAGFSAALALGMVDFATGFLSATAGLVTGAEETLGGDLGGAGDIGLAAALPEDLALATVFDADLATDFCGGWVSALAVFPGLVSNRTLGFAVVSDLVLATAVLLSFPDVVFTSCLLADRSCAVSVGPSALLRLLVGSFAVASPARECTGFPTGKPISCKIETIIWFSIRSKQFKKQHSPDCCCWPRQRASYTSDCSIPCNKMSFGKSIPMNTILLLRASPSAHCGPKSLPINW